MSAPKVLVLGGGFAGLEAAFALRHKLGPKVALTLVSDRDTFLFRPNTIYVPFGEEPDRFRIALERPLRRKEIEFVRASARSIDPVLRTVEFDHAKLSYDYLVVATGSGTRLGEIPGLAEHAVTLSSPHEMLRLRAALQRVVDVARGGEWNRLLFLVPPNNRCAGPLYEITLMTDTWLRRAGVRDFVDIAFATCEEGYLQAFGPRLNTVVAQEFEERSIRSSTGFVVTGVEPGFAHFQNGEHRAFDLLVAAPPQVAKERFGTLPVDERGFVRVDPDSRRVKGHPRVFALGDASDFPLKQAFLALLQADAAADHLAAEIEETEPQVRFEPVTMCLLEELNKATFARVPLRYTDDPAAPVAVDLGDGSEYKVGVSPLWRAGKKMLGYYLPWRFEAGEPFYSGLAWEAMNLGLKAMTRMLAR